MNHASKKKKKVYQSATLKGLGFNILRKSEVLSPSVGLVQNWMVKGRSGMVSQIIHLEKMCVHNLCFGFLVLSTFFSSDKTPNPAVVDRVYLRVRVLLHPEKHKIWVFFNRSVFLRQFGSFKLCYTPFKIKLACWCTPHCAVQMHVFIMNLCDCSSCTD